MEKINFIYVIILLLSVNCSNNLKSAGNVSKSDTLYSSKELNLSAEFKSENEYRFIVEKDGKILKTQVMKMFPGGLPKFEKFENHWIYLKGGCGSSCFYAYLIPVNIEGENSLKTYMFPLFIDQSKNIIIYCSEETLMIENYVNDKKISFKDEKLIGPYCGFSIENMSVVGTDFIFQIKFNDSLIQKKLNIKSLF